MRGKAGRNRCEVDDIRKQDAGRAKFLCNRFGSLLELFRDLFGQDVIEKFVGLIPLFLNSAFLQEIPAAIAFKMIACEHPNDVRSHEEEVVQNEYYEASFRC